MQEPVRHLATASAQSNPPATHLKVLPKDTSEQDIYKIMASMQRDLGVQCGFCHEEDPDTKKIAGPFYLPIVPKVLTAGPYLLVFNSRYVVTAKPSDIENIQQMYGRAPVSSQMLNPGHRTNPQGKA